MKALYGITNNNIYLLANYIHEFKNSLPEEKRKRLVTQILGFEDTIRDDVKILLVPTVNLFTKHLAALDKINAVIFVFDAAVLCDYLKPIKLLDVDRKNNSYTYVFKKELPYKVVKSALLSGLRSTQRIKITSETVDVIPNMLETVKGSIIKPILNYLYTIPDTDKRFRHQAAIIQWMVMSDNPVSELNEVLYSLTGKRTKSLKTLMAYLESEQALDARKAIRYVFELRRMKKPVNYKKLEKTYPRVDSFDIKYILKLYKRVLSFKVEDRELCEILKERKLNKLKLTKLKEKKNED